MTIRPATQADIPAIQGLLAEAKLNIDGMDYSDFSHPCLIAEREGEVVGFMSAVAGKPYAIITECVIASAHQRKSYAYRLLQGMELIFRGMGITQWVTFVGQNNDRMRDGIEGYGARCIGYGAAYVRVL